MHYIKKGNQYSLKPLERDVQIFQQLLNGDLSATPQNKSQRFLLEAVEEMKRYAIERNTYSQPAFPNWEHRSSLQSLVLRHRRSKGGDKTSTPSNQRPESGRWYLLLLTLPCNTGWSN